MPHGDPVELKTLIGLGDGDGHGDRLKWYVLTVYSFLSGQVLVQDRPGVGSTTTPPSQRNTVVAFEQLY